jgi:hypothetical protein
MVDRHRVHRSSMSVRLVPSVLATLGLIAAITACTPSATPVRSFGPIASLPPGNSLDGQPGGGSSGGSGGGAVEPTPGGTFGDVIGDPPIVGGGGGAGIEPGDPVIVVAHPGMANVHPAHPYELASRIDATGHVIVRVRWWGGIEPCGTLDSVVVRRDGSAFTLTVQLGSQPGQNVACIEIARDTATLVDLGVLGSGTYSVRADPGDAPPLTVQVP